MVEKRDEIIIESLTPESVIEEKPLIQVGGELNPQITSLPKGGSPVRFVNGEIEIDKDALEAEKKSVTDWLKRGVLDGDNRVLNVYLRNLLDTDDEEVMALRNQLTEAFKTRNPNILQLDALHVGIPTNGIAERNLIREGLRPELARQPFIFRDRNNNPLTGEDELDIVFSRREGSADGFKIIIGSKKGVDAIVLPEKLGPTKFVPDLMKIDKNSDNDAIIVPLKNAADGTTPFAGVIEVRKGPIDIIEVLALEERKEAARKSRSRRDEPSPAPSSPSYTPSPSRPSSGRWTSSSG